ncbi:MAG: delta-class carbonic anhydrase, partial [Paracoccus sp. (in: a-proteobacteria)]|nr:delta-class carbonic anhydrase [Paracoccus sp. (in: a-proteobacteria)]
RAATEGAGYGPQSPRDIDQSEGENNRIFTAAPDREVMNLCNIHIHESAEHKGGEFTTYAGNGDGKGYGTGYVYDGTLTEAELAPIEGDNLRTDLEPGDTIEVHYVYSTAHVGPGVSLGACLNDAAANPQLRAEAQVLVLVNDPEAEDFGKLMEVVQVDDLYQAVNIPTDTGEPVEYAGSTTGPAYNEAGSPLKVTWAVRPQVKKVDAASVLIWLSDNAFDEDHAHGVRNLVDDPELLSEIGL